MVTFLITFLVIIGFLVVAIYLWSSPVSSNQEAPLLPPDRPPAGLFSSQEPEDASTQPQELSPAVLERQAGLRARAAAGDKTVLREAIELGPTDFYRELMESLVTATDSEPRLLALLSYVSSESLPVSRELAERFIESWRIAPNRDSTAKMLHLAALSDDAEIYNLAVEETFHAWREGRLAGVSPVELRAVLDGEFWLLSPGTRNSGAGFLLKRTLADARRELDAAINTDSQP